MTDREYSSKEKHKEYLANGIIIGFETTVVGILATLENHFGDLWGHGKHKDDLTEDEEYFRHIWNEVRGEIFQKGHKSKDITLDHLDDYSIRKTKVYRDFDD